MNYYGDNNRWFLARVVRSVTGSSKDGLFDRVQIRVIGLHSPDVPDKDLPYAKCMIPTTEGGVSGIGLIPQLLEGAFVFGIFLDGSASQKPLILGSLGHQGIPSSVQRDRIDKTNPGQPLTSQYVTQGIILDKKLETLYNNGDSDFNTKMIIIMQYLVKAGLSTRAAAGITGNLMKESLLDPTAENRSSIENSFGLAQWNANVGRYQQLVSFAETRNKPWEDFFTQLEFLIIDMKTNPAHKVWNHLSDPFKTTNFDQGPGESNATWYFLRKYEVAAYSDNELNERQQNAKQAFDGYYESLKVTANYKSSQQFVVG
tara:strand:- start:31387 stop:32331 length:945 start_codon:yes stop_codon:yes gene_type:complete